MKKILFIIYSLLLCTNTIAQVIELRDSVFYAKALNVVLNEYENKNELFLLDTIYDRSFFILPRISFFEDTTEYYSTKDCWLAHDLNSCDRNNARSPIVASFFSGLHSNDTVSAKYLVCLYQPYECGNYLFLQVEVLPIKRGRFVKGHEVFWYDNNSRYTVSSSYRFWFDVRDNSIYKCTKSNIHHE